MFPKWFDSWNSENPTNVFGPAILVGALGGAVFVAALLVTWGDPFYDEFDQTGPRGTGMQIAALSSTVDPTIADYYTEEPYPREEGEPLASEIYENVQVLGGVSEGNFLRLMNAITIWVSPDEGCAYCHAGADEGNYADDDLYTKAVARRMIQMTQYINEDYIGHVQANAEVGVNCNTCHRGQPVPTNVWFRIDPVTDATAGWASVQNRATIQSQSTSLPSDALYRYLYEDNVIAVHDLESRVAGSPSDPGFPTVQDTERTYSLMNYFANSLGVNCVFCHNSRAFYDGAQVTPQWATASLGIYMAQDLNNIFLEPLGPVYPPERLGPVYADAPKAACATCHKGYNKPMQGLNAIADWPELASTEPPVYE
ncbi:photosynthetic reaction center cytochrome PufC [Jannaschia sp. 2305UL9-9]|uniref:photosynthetic reaction center cytochrome PufC n=1 Tax=Jannaschia sp. 2305UL9-9 TaxID=3121638 RepID=UPI003526C9B8